MLATIFAVHFAILFLCEVNARPNFWETNESEFPRGLLENRARKVRQCDPKTGAYCCKEDKKTTIKNAGKNCAEEFCTDMYEECNNYPPSHPKYNKEYSCTGIYKYYCVGSCPHLYSKCEGKPPAAKQRCEIENPGKACCEDGRVVEPDKTCNRMECRDVPGVCSDANYKASACNSRFYLVRSFVQKMCPEKCNVCPLKK